MTQTASAAAPTAGAASSGLTDEQLADQIREDQIDILVDLTLHMAQQPPAGLRPQARPGAGDLRSATPAPPAWTPSTIASPIPTSIPPGMDESLYSEQTIRLPDSFWCYDPLDAAISAVSPLPALANGFITFGCLNNFCKVNEPTLRLWAKVLRAVPDSRLLLLAPKAATASDA